MSRDGYLIQIKVSYEARKQIKLVALERDMTIRTLILTALNEAGVEIPDEDLGNARGARAVERVAART